MKTMRWCGKTMAGLWALLLLAATANGAHAGVCSYDQGTNGQATYAFTVPATIALTGSEKTGDVLWSSTAAGGDRTVWANCPGRAGSAGLIDNYGHTTTSLAGSYNVFPTNVAGVGFAISVGGFPSGIQGYPSNPDGVEPNNNYNTLTATFQFIKTSTAYFSGASATTNMFGDLATWYVVTNQLRLAHFTISNKTTFTIAGGGGGGTTTCSIAPVTVPLGSVSTTQLPSKTVPFSVSITCNNPPKTLNNVTLKPQNSIFGISCNGTMQNSSGGAGGVGIQIVDEAAGDPVCWNQADSTDYSSSFSKTQKTVRLAYSAKMVRTTGTVTPGRVTGAATVSFNYN